ncbi:hypothetical protein GCM10023148_34510 [Actinokineospora soli]
MVNHRIGPEDQATLGLTTVRGWRLAGLRQAWVWSTSAVGGTALSVLSPYPAGRVEPVVVAEMSAEGMTQHAAHLKYWHSNDGTPYGYSLNAPDSETEQVDLRLIERAAGEAMRCDILLHVFVSDLAGRPVLGRLAQRVAARTAGWVFVEFQVPPSTRLLDHFETAGRCIRVNDYVYLDALAMAAWCAHPDFHVIK